MRRANLLPSTTFQMPPSRAISITAPPTAAISTSACAFDVLRLVSRPAAETGEHQVGIDVLVVGDQQEAVAAAAAGRQRIKAEIVVVVAELLFLGGGRLIGRIEGRRAGDDGIAPADHHLHVVALGDMLLGVERVRELLEGERGRPGLLRRRRRGSWLKAATAPAPKRPRMASRRWSRCSIRSPIDGKWLSLAMPTPPANRQRRSGGPRCRYYHSMSFSLRACSRSTSCVSKP